MNINSGDTPIEHVHEGMRVVDVDGAVVGKVKDVAMGDPEAVTVEGALGGETAADTLIGTGAAAGRRNVPHVDQSRLMRTGYVMVHPRGLFSRSRYAAADEIAEVEGEVVHLTVPAKRLAS